MTYSDRQRVQKIYDYAVQLQEYIRKNDIEKEELLTQLPLQWLVTTPLYNRGSTVIICPQRIRRNMLKSHGR